MSSLDKQSADHQSKDRFWQSINELSQTPEVLAELQLEHPDVKGQDLSSLSRRQFARLMAASLALAGTSLTGCRRWPKQVVRPQSERTEGFSPGVAEYFATQFELDGIATGILAKSVDGRPIKIEGNGLHPFSKGAAGVFAQSSILELYDPDRTRGYIYRPQNAPISTQPLTGEAKHTPRLSPAAEAFANASGFQVVEPAENTDQTKATYHTKETFETFARIHFAALQKDKGRGLHVLAQTNSSPTFAALRRQFQSMFPDARWHVFQPLDRDQEFSGSEMVFDRPVRPQYHLENASTIVSLGCDLLGSHPGHQRWCRDWSTGRNPAGQSYNRMWVFESGYSMTGAAADLRLPVRPSKFLQIAEAIAAGLGIPDVTASSKTEVPLELIDELKRSGKHSLLVAGPAQPPRVHALVHLINQHLGAVGTTVHYTREPAAEPKTGTEAMEDLVGALKGGSAETLLILGGNPVYNCPTDLKLELTSNRRLTSIYLGLFDNETAQQCTWHAPATHYLEAWNDGRGWDGSYGIGQPLIYPLFNGLSEIELISLVLGKPIENGMELIRETARDKFGIESEKAWNQLLHDGVLTDSKFETIAVEAKQKPSKPLPKAEVLQGDRFEVCYTTDASTHDGRFANNGWLQELPGPLTKLTWDNAALISKHDADKLSLSNDDVISIKVEPTHEALEVPVLVQPGQAPGTIDLPLGYGRQTGIIASGVGVNAYTIRSSENRFFAEAEIKKTGQRRKLACTQEHHLIDSVGMAAKEFRIGEKAKPGALVRETSLQAHQNDPHAVHEGFHVPKAAPMFNQPDTFNTPCSWGMSIDLNSCVGCNACVIACQSENNIPIVGKANVIQNREMHWLRIDRYYKGEAEDPDVVHVPMACAHCEDAPCEQVCPVAATVHDTEGLNAMVYNRCVGTRYCANNCPYKVRRFNYFDYHSNKPKAPPQPWLNIPDQQLTDKITELEQMKFNPEVSVRMRGVMEKCTYCVQRISGARISARNEHAKGKRENSILRDGEVVTACQQSCPTQAIRFGDLNDPDSEVSKAQNDDRAYAMLEETNIKPRTRYLARVRNIVTKLNANEEVEHGHG